ncbi:MAG: hypothetical protein B7X37_04905 [Halothiobacillus sp. 14-55-98]|jgi:regulator of nucleoside diphosphate kinase|nr:MAG: hypothetical protein B7X37_04905 [Halothiobacillus sp. 14-55-98]
MKQKPPITISSLDAVRLEKMLDSLGDKQIPDKEGLRAELDRANILEPEEMPHDVVTMNSTVTFRMESSSTEYSGPQI